jgi:hypothetical protein
MLFRQLEVGKQIAREHGFGYPAETLTGRPLESDSWVKNTNALQFPKMRCGDVLALGLRP